MNGNKLMRLERIVLWSYAEGGYLHVIELRVYAEAPVVVCGYTGGSLHEAIHGKPPDYPATLPVHKEAMPSTNK